MVPLFFFSFFFFFERDMGTVLCSMIFWLIFWLMFWLMVVEHLQTRFIAWTEKPRPACHRHWPPPPPEQGVFRPPVVRLRVELGVPNGGTVCTRVA